MYLFLWEEKYYQSSLLQETALLTFLHKKMVKMTQGLNESQLHSFLQLQYALDSPESLINKTFLGLTSSLFKWVWSGIWNFELLLRWCSWSKNHRKPVLQFSSGWLKNCKPFNSWFKELLKSIRKTNLDFTPTPPTVTVGSI